MLKEYKTYIKTNIGMLSVLYISTMIPGMIFGFYENTIEAISIVISSAAILYFSKKSYIINLLSGVLNCTIAIFVTLLLLNIFGISCKINMASLIFKSMIITSLLYWVFNKCNFTHRNRVFSMIVMFLFLAAMSNNV